MGKVRFYISMSLDGYVAGPNQSTEAPLGVGGEDLHNWVVELESWRNQHGLEGGVRNASDDVVKRVQRNFGAEVMGRNMFGGGPGDWGDGEWTGWWGDNPPFHMPVYVLTHYARESVEMAGDTVYHFVTDGIESALAQAKEAAGDKDVLIAGGANVIQQYLAAGLIDEFTLHVTSLILGDGERLFEDVGDLRLEQIEAVDGPGVTHLTYRVVR